MTKEDYINYKYKLNQVYTKLIELTEGEEDQELKEYNEQLLDNIQEIIQYFNKRL